MDSSRVVKDSSEILDVISDGGVGIIPLDVAYAIVGNSEKAIKTIFKAKNRSFDKPSGMFSNWELFNEIQIVGQKERDIIQCVTIDNDLPLNESITTAKVPRNIAKPNCRLIAAAKITASKIAAKRTSVFENAMPTKKFL